MQSVRMPILFCLILFWSNHRPAMLCMPKAQVSVCQCLWESGQWVASPWVSKSWVRWLRQKPFTAAPEQGCQVDPGNRRLLVTRFQR